ncbi:hypothetical protein ACE6H2_014628 [Prunus campanulata]
MLTQTRHECQVHLWVHALSQSKPVMGPSERSFWQQLKDCVLLLTWTYLTCIILEIDAKECITGILSEEELLSAEEILSAEEYNETYGLLLEEAKCILSKFRVALCQWSLRSYNKVAHTLAQFAISFNDFVSLD